MLKKILTILCFVIPLQSLAKEEKSSNLKYMEIEEALKSPQFDKVITSKIPYFFADQSHPEIEKTILVSNSTRTVNVTFKFGNDSCISAFLQTLAALQQTAEAQQADAIVNVRSSFEGRELSSTTNYLCDPGFFVASVGLKADIVNLKK